MGYKEYIITDIKKKDGEPIGEFHQDLIGRRCYFIDTPFPRYSAYIKVEFPGDEEFSWHTIRTTPVEEMEYNAIERCGTITTMNSIYFLREYEKSNFGDTNE